MAYTKEQLIKIFRRLATNGTAPDEGCELFGVGYDDAFNRLIREYVVDALPAGESSEKFIIGPYGSGKTHFLRHFMALARNRGCVASEVQLNKKIDYTQSLVVYSEVAANVRAPGQEAGGVAKLLEASLSKLERQCAPQCPTPEARAEFIESWVGALSARNYKFPEFGKILQRALTARIQEDQPVFEGLCRWIQGEVANKQLIQDLPRNLYLSPAKKSDQQLLAGKLMLSLCQFIRYAGYPGTIVGFDEAEQGLDVSRERQQKILSMLQADINAVADLQDGAVLILYALTPQLEAKFSTFPPLQQRIDVPPDGDFFVNANNMAAKIDLTRRDDPASELKAIGTKLADLFFQYFGSETPTPYADALRHVHSLVDHIIEKEFDSSNRRTMVKATCAYLWKLRKTSEEPEDQKPQAQGEV